MKYLPSVRLEIKTELSDEKNHRTVCGSCTKSSDQFYPDYVVQLFMKKLPNDAALIIIDVQKGFDNPKWGERNNLQAGQNIERLLRAWRESKRPVFHIQHLSASPESPLNPNSMGSEIKDIVKPKDDEVAPQ